MLVSTRHKAGSWRCCASAARIVKETYEDDRIEVTALVTPKLAGQMRKLLAANSAPATAAQLPVMLNLPNTLTLIRILTIPIFLGLSRLSSLFGSAGGFCPRRYYRFLRRP